MEDRYVAYILDNAIHHFGSALEVALGDVEGKNKRDIEMKQNMILSQWLDLPMKYRNPTGMVGPGKFNDKSDVVEGFVMKGEPTL